MHIHAYTHTRTHAYTYTYFIGAWEGAPLPIKVAVLSMGTDPLAFEQLRCSFFIEGNVGSCVFIEGHVGSCVLSRGMAFCCPIVRTPRYTPAVLNLFWSTRRTLHGRMDAFGAATFATSLAITRGPASGDATTRMTVVSKQSSAFFRSCVFVSLCCFAMHVYM